MPETPHRPLGVALIGYAFMGAAHSQAWRTAGRFFDLPLQPEPAVLCGRDKEKATAAADKLGWRSVETDWRALLTRDDVALVDVCSPGDTHSQGSPGCAPSASLTSACSLARTARPAGVANQSLAASG